MNVTSFFHTIFVAWKALTNTNQQRYKYWNCCAPVVSPKHKGLWNRIGIFSRLKRVCDTDIGCAMWGPSLHGPDTAKTLQVFADHDVGTAVGKGVFFCFFLGGWGGWIGNWFLTAPGQRWHTRGLLCTRVFQCCSVFLELWRTSSVRTRWAKLALSSLLHPAGTSLWYDFKTVWKSARSGLITRGVLILVTDHPACSN